MIRQAYFPSNIGTRVKLDEYISDLNLEILPEGFSCQPICKDGFAYMWAGAKASHGVRRGKVCYEVKIAEHMEVSTADFTDIHVVRVGWSTDAATLQLGEDKNSFGYGGTGRKSEARKFVEYGRHFGKGDVVGCYLVIENGWADISYCVNGRYCGSAFKVRWNSDEALFPHVLSKNCRLEINFGQAPNPYFSLQPGYKLIDHIPQGLKVPAVAAPATKQDCEVIMMVGLPGVGKSTWAMNYTKIHPSKKYNILGTDAIIDKMRVQGLPRKNNFGGRWDVLIKQASECFNVMLKKASNCNRNFILDQTNVYASARKRKVRQYKDAGYTVNAMVLVPTDEEMMRRSQQRTIEEGKEVPEAAVLDMKANFSLPHEDENLFSSITFLELQRDQAENLVIQYNADARMKGYKSNHQSGSGANQNQQEMNESKSSRHHGSKSSPREARSRDRDRSDDSRRRNDSKYRDRDSRTDRDRDKDRTRDRHDRSERRSRWEPRDERDSPRTDVKKRPEMDRKTEPPEKYRKESAPYEEQISYPGRMQPQRTRPERSTDFDGVDKEENPAPVRRDQPFNMPRMNRPPMPARGQQEGYGIRSVNSNIRHMTNFIKQEQQPFTKDRFGDQQDMAWQDPDVAKYNTNRNLTGGNQEQKFPDRNQPGHAAPVRTRPPLIKNENFQPVDSQQWPRQMSQFQASGMQQKRMPPQQTGHGNVFHNATGGSRFRSNDNFSQDNKNQQQFSMDQYENDSQYQDTSEQKHQGYGDAGQEIYGESGFSEDYQKQYFDDHNTYDDYNVDQNRNEQQLYFKGNMQSEKWNRHDDQEQPVQSQWADASGDCDKYNQNEYQDDDAIAYSGQFEGNSKWNHQGDQNYHEDVVEEKQQVRFEDGGYTQQPVSQNMESQYDYDNQGFDAPGKNGFSQRAPKPGSGRQIGEQDLNFHAPGPSRGGLRQIRPQHRISQSSVADFGGMRQVRPQVRMSRTDVVEFGTDRKYEAMSQSRGGARFGGPRMPPPMPQRERGNIVGEPVYDEREQFDMKDDTTFRHQQNAPLYPKKRPTLPGNRPGPILRNDNAWSADNGPATGFMNYEESAMQESRRFPGSNPIRGHLEEYGSQDVVESMQDANTFQDQDYSQPQGNVRQQGLEDNTTPGGFGRNAARLQPRVGPASLPRFQQTNQRPESATDTAFPQLTSVDFDKLKASLANIRQAQQLNKSLLAKHPYELSDQEILDLQFPPESHPEELRAGDLNAAYQGRQHPTKGNETFGSEEIYQQGNIGGGFMSQAQEQGVPNQRRGPPESRQGQMTNKFNSRTSHSNSRGRMDEQDGRDRVRGGESRGRRAVSRERRERKDEFGRDESRPVRSDRPLDSTDSRDRRGNNETSRMHSPSGSRDRSARERDKDSRDKRRRLPPDSREGRTSLDRTRHRDSVDRKPSSDSRAKSRSKDPPIVDDTRPKPLPGSPRIPRRSEDSNQHSGSGGRPSPIPSKQNRGNLPKPKETPDDDWNQLRATEKLLTEERQSGEDIGKRPPRQIPPESPPNKQPRPSGPLFTRGFLPRPPSRGGIQNQRMRFPTRLLGHAAASEGLRPKTALLETPSIRPLNLNQEEMETIEQYDEGQMFDSSGIYNKEGNGGNFLLIPRGSRPREPSSCHSEFGEMGAFPNFEVDFGAGMNRPPFRHHRPRGPRPGGRGDFVMEGMHGEHDDMLDFLMEGENTLNTGRFPRPRFLGGHRPPLMGIAPRGMRPRFPPDHMRGPRPLRGGFPQRPRGGLLRRPPLPGMRPMGPPGPHFSA